ncbi:hypothetical protein [Cochlodiniinecator piscidefendens]|nr:hypothetical protein [Cochlodiniinecator piscidefendens]
MGRIIKAVIFLVVIGFLGVTTYAYLGDMSPEQVEVRESVTLDFN